MNDSTKESLTGLVGCAVIISTWIIPVVAGISVASTTSVSWIGGLVLAGFLMWLLPTVIERGLFIVCMLTESVDNASVTAWRRALCVLVTLLYAAMMLVVLGAVLLLLLFSRFGFWPFVAAAIGISLAAYVADAATVFIVGSLLSGAKGHGLQSQVDSNDDRKGMYP